MNNSWKGSSPGFVYFQNNVQSPQPAETSDYIELSRSCQTPNKFKPSRCSSPQGRNWNNNPQNRNWNNSPHNKTWGNSPQNKWGNNSRNFNNQRGGYRSKRYSDYNSYSPNRSFNNSNSSGKFNNSRGEIFFNKNAFLQKSFMENPWAELEIQLEERRKERIDGIDDKESCSSSMDEES